MRILKYLLLALVALTFTAPAWAGTAKRFKYGMRLSEEASAHSTPPAGYGEFYVNDDSGTMTPYFLDDAGTESSLIQTTSTTAWDDLGVPDANESLDMTDYYTAWDFGDTDHDMMAMEFTGAFADVSGLLLEQKTGNPTNGTLLELKLADTDPDFVSMATGGVEKVNIADDGSIILSAGDVTLTAGDASVGGTATLTTVVVNTLLDVNEEIDVDLDDNDEEINVTTTADDYATGSGVITVYDDSTGQTSASYLLRLAREADGDAQDNFILCEDNSTGAAANGDDMFKVDTGGAVTAAGTITGTGTITGATIQATTLLDVNEDVDVDLDANDEEVSVVSTAADYAAGSGIVTIYDDSTGQTNASYLIRAVREANGDAQDHFILCEDSSTGAAANGDDMFYVNSGGVVYSASTISATAGLSAGSATDSYLHTDTVELSNADIKVLRGTKKELIATPGANKFIEVVSAVIILDYGSNVFTESADNLVIEYATSGDDITAAIEMTGFIDQSADTIMIVQPSNPLAANAASDMVNNAVQLFNTGDGEFGGNAGADTTMTVKITYRVHADGL